MNKFIELHILDNTENLIVSNYNVSTFQYESNTLKLELQNELKKLGFISGLFKVKINLFESYIGSKNGLKIKINEISPNRKELRAYIPSNYLNYESYINDTYTFSILGDTWRNTPNMNLILNFFNNTLFQTINVELDDLNFTSYPFSIIFKFKDELPQSIKKEDEFIIVSPFANPILQTVKLIPTNNSIKLNILTNPNFDINVDLSNKQDINFYNLDNLITTDNSISNLLKNNFNSFEANSIKLNIDYSDFNNFVFYSSAENRLINFRYKLNKIQQLETNESIVSGSLYKSQYVNSINEIKTSFDSFDNYLYYTSSSYSFPKDTNNIPLSVSNPTAVTWFNNRLEVATNYDLENKNRLANVLPANIVENEDNKIFLIFINMIAQHFDFLYFYIQHLDNLRNHNEDINIGLSKDLIYYVLKSYGWNPIHDTQYDDLSQYQLGITGSIDPNINYINVVSENLPTNDINKEIWKRIFNNLPYIYKTKGSMESVRALINCYGIPETILPVLEFGGPQKTDIKSKLIKYKFNYALQFTGNNETLTIPYYKPGTIEFRFKLNSKTTQKIFNRSDNNVYIQFEYLNNESGQVRVYTDSGLNHVSDNIDIYNDNWWTFAFRHNESTFVTSNSNSYDILLYQKKYDNIITNFTSSFSTSDTNINSDLFNESTDYIISLTGSLQEFRYWDTPLNNDIIENHVYSPTSYNSNNVSGSYDDLIYRLPLGTNTDKFNHNVTTILPSQHPASGSELNNNKIATFNNFPNEYNYESVKENYIYSWPDISGNRTLSNKVRLEENSLFKQLDPKSRSELSSFNTQPVDDNKLGVYFSPSFEINEDISEHMDGVNIDDFLADELSEFNNEYDNLNSIRNYYFKQYYGTFRIADFFNSVNHYFPSVFKYINQITPARTNKLTGITIEPHLLNRSKVSPLNNKIVVKSNYSEAILDVNNYIIFDNEITNKNAEIDLYDLSWFGENTYYETELELNKFISNDYDLNIINFINGIPYSVDMDNRYSGGSQQYIDISKQSDFLEVLNPLRNELNQPKYIPANINDYSQLTSELIYKGSKLISEGFNVNSDDIPDGSPIIELFDISETSMVNNNGNINVI